MPVLLYNCENWLLTNALLDKLERFQVELEENSEITFLPLSERAVRLALDLPSLATRLLSRKLVFLRRLSSDQGTASAFFAALSQSQTSSVPLKILESCEFLEEKLGHNYGYG